MTSQAYKDGYDRIDWSVPLPAPERRSFPKGRSHLPCPMLIRDFDEPVQSMANGKWYTSKRALAASHRASGNPHGQDFIELGNEDLPFVEHKADEKQLRDDIRAAKAAVDAGWCPEIAVLDD